MKKYTLNALERNLVGRKVKQLRATGTLPATVYGKKVKSMSVSVKATDFSKVYGSAGESGLVELKMEGNTAGLPAGRQVLIHNVQKDAVSGKPLHVEFYQVDLKEKVHAKVPVEFTGEAQAIKDKQGVLLTILDEIEVEALPTELPEKLTVDISGLAAVNAEIKVSDLKVPSAVTILTDSGLTIVKIGALITKEAEAEAAAAAATAAAAAAESAAAAGTAAAPAEAGAPAPETPAETGTKAPAAEKAPEEKK
jgi:large subunit ribosomal protein L25